MLDMEIELLAAGFRVGNSLIGKNLRLFYAGYKEKLGAKYRTIYLTCTTGYIRRATKE